MLDSGHPNCDGCARELPIVNGNHVDKDKPWDLQHCTADRYKDDLWDKDTLFDKENSTHA